jgi:hypothetical protein
MVPGFKPGTVKVVAVRGRIAETGLPEYLL